MKKIAGLAAAAAICLFLSGCNSSNELYERLLINSIGVDSHPDGYKVTLRCAEKSGDDEIYEGVGKSVREAVDDITLTAGRKPFYAHNRLILFGKDCCARGLSGCLDLFSRNSEMAARVKVAVANGEASEVLRAEKNGKPVSMDELDALSEGGKYNGMTAQRTLVEFMNSGMREGGSAYAPIFTEEDGVVSVTGTALFSEFAYQGELSLEETRGLLSLTAGIGGGTAVIKAQSLGEVTLSLRSSKPEIEVSAREEEISFRINIEIKSIVKSVSDKSEDLTGEDFENIEQALSQMIKEEAESALNTALKENGCDVFGFGNMLYLDDPAYWKRNSRRWDELKKNLGISIEVKSGVSRV